MIEDDREAVLNMMRTFYASEAVLSDGSDEIFNNDINECVSDSTFAEGFAFVREDGTLGGYAMLAHSYSTEFGSPCVWIEDIYFREDMRGRGLVSVFLDMVRQEYPDAVHRLEAERENERAVGAYTSNGFVELPYLEMIRRD